MLRFRSFEDLIHFFWFVGFLLDKDSVILCIELNKFVVSWSILLKVLLLLGPILKSLFCESQFIFQFVTQDALDFFKILLSCQSLVLFFCCCFSNSSYFVPFILFKYPHYCFNRVPYDGKVYFILVISFFSSKHQTYPSL